MSDSNSPENSPKKNEPWADALVDTLLQETTDGGEADEAFLASVESAIDAESDSTSRIVPIAKPNSQRLWMWSSGIAAVLVVGVSAWLASVQLREERGMFAHKITVEPTLENGDLTIRPIELKQVQENVNSSNEMARSIQLSMSDPSQDAGISDVTALSSLDVPSGDSLQEKRFSQIGHGGYSNEKEPDDMDSYGIVEHRTDNTSARYRLNYYDAAYDHTRAKMLKEVADGWSSPVPESTADGLISEAIVGQAPAQIAGDDLDIAGSMRSAETRRSGQLSETEARGGKSAVQPGKDVDFTRNPVPKLQVQRATARPELESKDFGDVSLSPVVAATEDTEIRADLVATDDLIVHLELPVVGKAFVSTARPAYSPLIDNPWFSPLDDPLSTFSIDVDTASWTNLRAMIRSGRSADAIPNDAVRIEELINYFSWEYPQPDGERPFAFATETAECPWNEDHRLMRVGIQGREIPKTDRPDANLVFLLDVSGSMDQPNKLPLVKRAISVLVEEMKERDTVSIVVYAGAEGLALRPTSGRDQITIQDSLDNLDAGGSTNGGAGIKLAYKVAREQFVEGGVNRVILCTDGDFNVGTTGTEELVSLVEKEAESGVFLSVCGFGQDNLNDGMLEEITNKGNGNYAYIDGFREARKVFLQDLMGTLVTIAKDVKIQIEFNPAKVDGYRLIGYANRKLEAEDFENDEIDAGEVGSGHAVTALYEIVPAGAKDNPADDEIGLRYQAKDRPAPRRKLIPSGELALLKLRYKLPDGEQSILMEQPVMPAGGKWKRASEDFRFASAVGLFGMLLREHESVGDATFADVIDMAARAKGDDPHGWRAEFVDLVKQLADR